MSDSIGVLLMNLGGPPDLAAVPKFMYALFCDRQIIQFPGGPLLQKPFAWLLTRLRTRKVQAQYASIGGGSPLLRWTSIQARLLEERLNGEGGSGVGDQGSGIRALERRFKVGIAMRYHHPRASEVTLYPQYSTATTGSSIRDLDRASLGPAKDFQITYIDRYHNHPLYLDALAARVKEGLAAMADEFRDETVLLFSAHGLPKRLIEKGDPYVDQVKSTMEGVLSRLHRPYEHCLGFQSRVGPIEWIGPETSDLIRKLAESGKRAVLAVPVAFVSDHIETLHEIDQVYSKLARDAGISCFRRSPSINDSRLFADALADLVKAHLTT
ncbi:MAG: ferrochelatase [Armatimonadetes bacterium]|nr:ferrochelatase [Armatimonadota bacterium]